jgi:hypothetical protein
MTIRGHFFEEIQTRVTLPCCVRLSPFLTDQNLDLIYDLIGMAIIA